MRWEISNFDYLMALNTLAGRSFSDLNQYPVGIDRGEWGSGGGREGCVLKVNTPSRRQGRVLALQSSVIGTGSG